MGRGRPKKDKFDILDAEFKNAVAGMDEVAIRKKISEIALNQVALLIAKENDQDLAEKKEAYSVAGEVYREGSKMNKVSIEFCRQVLSDKGKSVGSFEVE